MSLITLQHHDRVFACDEILAQGQPTRHHTTSRIRMIPHQKQTIPSGTRSICKLPFTGAEDNKDKNPGNVAGGLKATLNNPNVSDEAKKNAKERLDKEDF
ncbi:hypothetical protein HZS61_003758 [Fusarium oxysporum f. sp. conglutinans]|uniref:Conidiation-specific protein 6 n=1 Tax=Fusarium oxysporum f. sp. conglutinans TaxID=100902 RepID=A0A8H6GFT4_FUSOX|nr:hypothetical protein HZS61_003758 [Fusarium oxysporum f. sp. conglutinans]